MIKINNTDYGYNATVLQISFDEIDENYKFMKDCFLLVCFFEIPDKLQNGDWVMKSEIDYKKYSFGNEEMLALRKKVLTMRDYFLEKTKSMAVMNKLNLL